MSGGTDYDKMVIFGRYLTERSLVLSSELYSSCINIEKGIDAIRLKTGQLECCKEILRAFTDLYNGDIPKFKQEYLDEDEEEVDTASENRT